uniref:BTB/POZ domain-containing protein n=1 Tax=Candidatus Protochlamydia sp. R18 TaxID=1353977 RepID=UPI0005A93CEE
MNTHNNINTPTVNPHVPFYNLSNEHLKFSERIVLLCKIIFQSFLNLFFNNVNKKQLQSQWREIFWGTKEIAVSNDATNHRLCSLLSSLNPSSSLPKTRQQGSNYPASENKLATDSPNTSADLNPSNNLSSEEIESTIQPSVLLFLPSGFKLNFQDGTFLHLSSSQLDLLKEQSPYFKNLWSGNFKETLQTPLALTQKEFTCLFHCLLDAHFKVPLEEIPSIIQRADYYQLTEVVKNLEQQLLDGYKSEKFELFNSSEDSLVELKELLNFAHQYHLNALKNYLESTVVSTLLNQTSDL